MGRKINFYIAICALAFVWTATFSSRLPAQMQGAFQKMYALSDGGALRPLGLTQCPNGRFILLFSGALPFNRVLVVCTEPDGTPLWTANIDHTEPNRWSAANAVQSVAATSDNGSLIYLSLNNITNTEEIRQYIVKINEHGQIEWSKWFDRPQFCFQAYPILAVSDSSLYVGFRSCDPAQRFYLARLDYEGHVLWEKTMDRPADCVAAGGLPDGGALLVLLADEQGKRQSHMMRLSPDGRLSPLLSLPDAAVADAFMRDERLFFVVTGAHSLDNTGAIKIGMAQGGHLVWAKQLTYDHASGAASCAYLVPDMTSDSMTLVFFNGGVNLLRIGPDGGQGRQTVFPLDNVCFRHFSPLHDGGIAWLSTLSPVLTRLDREGALPQCPQEQPCRVQLPSIVQPTAATGDWILWPAEGLRGVSLLQSSYGVLASDYCPLPLPPLNAAFSASDTTACVGKELVFKQQMPVPGDRSRWYKDQVFFAGGSPLARLTFPDTGQYAVAHVATRGVCSDTAHLTVRVLPSAAFNLPTGAALCAGEYIDIRVKGLHPNAQFAWLDGSRDTVRRFSVPGVYAASQTAPGSCRYTTDITIVEKPTPAPVFQGETTICKGDTAAIRALDANPETILQWVGADGPVLLTTQSGWYTAVASLNGCSLRDSVQITLRDCPECRLYIPNAFSPLSADNAQFSIHADCLNAENFLMQVFDRWGQLVFESKEASFVWDGFFRGRCLPAGVYFYQMTGDWTNGERRFAIRKQGDLTLLR